jgi:transposase
MNNLNNIFKIISKKSISEIAYNEQDIVKFYLQLLKMKKKRPHINTLNLLNKCYPNANSLLNKVIDENNEQ